MPIHPESKTVRPTQSDFGQIAYDVTKCLYGIHQDFGRFFDEAVYKRELANRMEGIQIEVPVTVTYKSFSKRYAADVMAHNQAIFEIKTVESIVPRHRAQTINYLLLFDLPHGKIVNVRSEHVREEFINCHLRLRDLRKPFVTTVNFDTTTPGALFFRDQLLEVLCDIGSGLETELYEEALTHLLGGDGRVLTSLPVRGTNGHLHDQKVRLVAPEIAFKITAFSNRSEVFGAHARRFLRHTSLKAIHWANITAKHVEFTTIR